MRLGIDASNIRAGGGLSHLAELLRIAQPESHGFEHVIVWGGKQTLARIEDRPWLRKVHEPLLDRALPIRLFWQKFHLDRLALQSECHVLFVPGGTYAGRFTPFVTMSQNLLPFQPVEARRYGFSWMFLKLQMLRFSQSQAMKRADGVIFLTDYARDVVMDTLKQIRGRVGVIPHGVNKGFDCPPRPQKEIGCYSFQAPFRILYVSIVTVYKHQWHVAEAVAALRRKGVPIHLDLIGPAYLPSLQRLQRTLRELDPAQEFICYDGPVSYDELHKSYHASDAFVFASSCETFGQIVTEAMLAGLPVACSNTGTMHELLGENAFYFDPEHPAEIADAIEKMLQDSALRQQVTLGSYARAVNYTWERCANDTFDFIAQVMHEYTD